MPIYSSADSLINFDTATDGSIELMLSGKAFYPNREIMAMHNLQEFGRGNVGKLLKDLVYITFENFRRIFSADDS